MAAPRIAIIGTGNFGTALRRLLDRYASDVPVRVLDRLPGGEAIADLDRLADSDVVIPAVPIAVFGAVLDAIAPHLRPEALVIDVCTVKEYPTRLMEKRLPRTVELVSSHPLF